MAATETPPSNTAVPITTSSIISLPLEPISEILKSISTESVDIDTTNSAIQEVLASNEIELGIVAPNKKLIEQVLGQLIGGAGFLYELVERRSLKGLYDLRIISLIGPLHVMPLAKTLQSLNRRISVYVGGNLVTAL